MNKSKKEFNSPAYKMTMTLSDLINSLKMYLFNNQMHKFMCPCLLYTPSWMQTPKIEVLMYTVNNVEQCWRQKCEIKLKIVNDVTQVKWIFVIFQRRKENEIK